MASTHGPRIGIRARYQGGEGPGHSVQWNRGIWSAAAVDAPPDLVRVDTGELRHGGADLALHRLVPLQVALERRAAGARGCQHARMLPGTVVEDGDRLRHLAAGRRRGRVVIRPMGPALERPLLQPGMRQQLSHDGQVAGLAVVRGGHQRDVSGRQLVAGDDLAAKRGNGLKGLGAGPEVGDDRWIAELILNPATGIDGGEVTSVGRLPDPAPLDRDQRRRRVRHGLSIGSDRRRLFTRQ